MKIIIAKEIGFCFGVKRAIKIVESNIKKMDLPVRMYGGLIHNEEIVKRICKLGIEIIDDLSKAKNGTLILTAHGISPIVKNKLKKRKKLKIIDTICPMVFAVHSTAKKLNKEGRRILIFGDPHHQEVIGIKGASGVGAIAISSKEDLLKFKFNKRKKYGIVVQTTQDLEKLEEIEKLIKNIGVDIKIINTICCSTRNRQREIKKIAKKTDIVLIVGSKKSANTIRLQRVASSINKNCYLIQNDKGIKKEWFKGKKSVSIGAGASTPELTVNKVIEKIKSFDD